MSTWTVRSQCVQVKLADSMDLGSGGRTARRLSGRAGSSPCTSGQSASDLSGPTWRIGDPDGQKRNPMEPADILRR